ncbi:MAG: mannose-6-phosphate isomerase [Clostridiales bacterium]|nr:mannose-6-phosphate isomerase [Clostridiales bacterium]
MLYPMELAPAYKDYLWGGHRLETLYGKKSGLPVTAESWELACHKDGKCTVVNGEYAGKTLSEVLQCGDDFPVLVKMIDAKKDLSIQVHPSDATAESENGEHGKAEMWYVVECEPKSAIYFGFSKSVNRKTFVKAAQDGTICQYLNRVPVHKGDVFFIRPGTIHAIGAGLLIAEIQQSSNTTFRVYDYQRRGADGKLRELHLTRAADVVNYEPLIPEECRVNAQAHYEGFTLAEMFSCQYFKAYRLNIAQQAALSVGKGEFHHLLTVEGEGFIRWRGEKYPIRAGSSYYLPKGLGDYEICGACKVLLTIA